MPQFVRVLDRLANAFDVVRVHGGVALVGVVDGDQRNAGGCQLLQFRMEKVNAGDKDAVQVAVAAVLQVAYGAPADGAVHEHEVVAHLFHSHLEVFQDADKEVVQQAVPVIILQQHADVETAVGLQSLGGRVGQIAHFARHVPDALRRLRADARHVVDRL